MADLAVQAAHLGLDVLLRPHISADRSRLIGHLVEHGGVDIVAHAEGEDARVARVLAGDVLENLLRVGLADGRLAIGEEDNGERPARVAAAHAESGEHGIVDGRAAGRFQLIDPLLRLLDGFLVHVGQAGLVGIDYRGEVHHGEAVLLRQVVENVIQRLLGLLHLDAAHAAGSIQDRTTSRGTWYDFALRHSA